MCDMWNIILQLSTNMAWKRCIFYNDNAGQGVLPYIIGCYNGEL